VRKQPAEPGTRFEQLRFRTTRRNPEFRRDLFVRVPFHIVEDEHRARTRRELLHGGIDRRRQHRALTVVLDRRRLFLYLRFHRLDSPPRSQGIQGSVDRYAVRPGREPRIATVRRERPEDLDPHFLRDVVGGVGVANQPPHYRVDTRCMQRPELAHGLLVASHGALNECLILLHHGLAKSVTGGRQTVARRTRKRLDW
jgi:hypothetical protein